MGRSVMTLGGDSIVAYNTFSPAHYCGECMEWHEEGEMTDDCPEFVYSCSFGCEHEEEFQDYLDWIKSYAQELFPSMSELDEWYDREVHIIAGNAHSVVAVAEYCGLVSISLGSNYDRKNYWRAEDTVTNLGAHWRSQVEKKFLEAFGEYQKIGTFSNGESVFEKVS